MVFNPLMPVTPLEYKSNSGWPDALHDTIDDAYKWQQILNRWQMSHGYQTKLLSVSV